MKTYEVWVSCTDSCSDKRPECCIHATKDQVAAERIASFPMDENHKVEVRVV